KEVKVKKEIVIETNEERGLRAANDMTKLKSRSGGGTATRGDPMLLYDPYLKKISECKNKNNQDRVIIGAINRMANLGDSRISMILCDKVSENFTFEDRVYTAKLLLDSENGGKEAA